MPIHDSGGSCSSSSILSRAFEIRSRAKPSVQFFGTSSICRLGVLLPHLLKLSHSRVQAPSRVWRRTVLEQRDGLLLVLDDSPSLRRRLPEFLDKAWPRARRIAIDALEEQDGI